MPNTFSVHDLACDAVNTYDRLPKTSVIASKLTTDIISDPTIDKDEVIRQLMPLAVSRAVSSTRSTMRDLAAPLRQNSSAQGATTSPTYQPSAWVKHAQSARDEFLRMIYPDAHGERKRLALFTVEDLDALAKRLNERRDALETQRTRIEALSLALSAKHLDRVELLDDDDIADAIDR